MKKIFTTTILLLLLLSGYSQTIDEIKNSGKYLWGFGELQNNSKANKLALSDLISQISVEVQSEFTNIITEEDGEIKDYTEAVIKTYSGTSLNGALKFETEKDGVYKIIRYIEREDLSKIFSDRKQKIIDYVKIAEKAEKEYRIAHALKNYYWAFILLRSHPENNTISFNFEDIGEMSLKTALPDKIDNIFSNISINIKDILYKKEEKYKLATLDIKYKNNPIQNFDYIYHYGDFWSPVQSARNGIGSAQFYNEAAALLTDVRIRIEYMFEYEAAADREISTIIENIDLPYFKNAELKVSLEMPKTDVAEVKNNTVEVSLLADTLTSDSITKQIAEKDTLNTLDTTLCLNTIEQAIKGIGDKDFESIKEHFTPEGYKSLNELIGYGKAELLTKKNPLKIAKVGEETVVRPVPMLFSFPNNNKQQFVENVVFVLDKENKIADINFALSDIAVGDIMSKDSRFGSNEEKYLLLRFMENYKTAYCLKRLDYIEKIFDDDALIIVGHKLVKDKFNDSYKSPQLNTPQIEYIRKSKKEFIRSLGNVFRSNEFVNIHFEDNEIKKAREDKKIYGIQISQYYTSSSYADKGYLFLMVDMQDSLKPRIYVRTWQPERTKEEEIFTLNDFPID